MGAEAFMGSIDPKVAVDWLKKTERILNQIGCPDDVKFDYVVALLEKDAYDWWLTVPGVVDNTVQLTWNDFLRLFKERYVPIVYQDQKKVEFLMLKQKEGQTVDEYEVTFHRLMKFAMDMVPTEKDKCLRFERGLRKELREMVSMSDTNGYGKLKAAAIRVEMILNGNKSRTQSYGIEDSKRKWKGSSSAGQSRVSSWGPSKGTLLSALE
ncbi:unnamed protein product [Linum trigynum]|uniref:Retrotransposon gag domain-containing protein n=1 Tax=Linum trigynum TaxID=586398 RepID=A0AAV2CTF5_9ROSI